MKEIIQATGRIIASFLGMAFVVFALWSWIWCTISDAKNDRYGWLIFDILAIPLALTVSVFRYGHYLLISFGFISADIGPDKNVLAVATPTKQICLQAEGEITRGMAAIKSYQDWSQNFDRQFKSKINDQNNPVEKLKDSIDADVELLVSRTLEAEKALSDTREAASRFLSEKCEGFEQMPTLISKLDQWSGGLQAVRMMINQMKLRFR